MSDIPFGVWDFILERLSLESLELCCQGLNKAWNEYLLEWRVRALCWVLAAKGVDEVERRLRRHHPWGVPTDLGRLDQVRRFVLRHRARVESVWEWMQLASQEPDAGWLCKGVSSVMMEGAGKCMMRQIVGKPQAFDMLKGTLCVTLYSSARDSAVTCVAWNRAGSLLASGSYDGTVRLWTPDGQEKVTLRGYSAAVLSVAWNHDGSLLASACWEGNTVRLWDPKTQEDKGTLRGHSRHNPECTCMHQKIRSWWKVKVNAECPVTGHSSMVRSVAWNHDGSLLATGSDDGTVQLWTPDGQDKGILRGHSKDNPECTCRHYMDSANFDRYEANPECPVRGHYKYVFSVAFSPDSKTLASASEDKTVRLWDLSGDAPVEKGTLTGHSGQVHCVAWNHDGSLLASSSSDWTVRLWTPDGQEKSTLRGHTYVVNCVAWNHDGSLLASASGDCTVCLWTPDGQKKGTLKGHDASWQGRDRETKELAAKVTQGRSAGSNGTDQYIATADGNMVYVYKTNSDREEQGEPLACFRSPEFIYTVSCRGTKVVVGCEDGQVRNCPLVARTLLYV